MTPVEIPRDQWRSFCESFSQQHHGWLVSVVSIDTRWLETEAAELERLSHRIARDIPLQSIRDERQNGQVNLSIIVGEDGHKMTYQVLDVIRLFSQLEDHAPRGLRVDAAGRMTTLLQFRTMARP